ncbi:MAG: heme peroxidase family protein [Vicinamibacterales bacterium]
MAKKRAPASKKSTDPVKAGRAQTPSDVDDAIPAYVREQLFSAAPRGRRRAARVKPESVQERLAIDVSEGDTVSDDLVEAAGRLSPAAVSVDAFPEDVRPSVQALRRQAHRFHGTKLNLAWFPWHRLVSPCADKFGYVTSPTVRLKTRLDFEDPLTRDLIDRLGALMGNPNREPPSDSSIPAGFTYVGQFVDHDITLDVSSSLDVAGNAEKIHNMRTPVLDLDPVYGDGPALHPFLYVFPSAGPSTAIKFQLGSNTNQGPGGSSGASGMVARTDFDVPRVHNPANPAASTRTAIIGDPRNDENLIISQLHHAMLRFHNKVVDSLVLATFSGDIFVEARKVVTHHYQWAVVNDYLRTVCGSGVVDKALSSVSAPVNGAFRMPAEFAMAAYRFGHSMIRDTYWVNFNFPSATLGQVFQFIRNPQLPVFSNWVVDFNAFFTTGVAVPVNNRARKIDSVLANGLETLPGFSGLMAVLAQRNLRRGLALGLPSGQGVAGQFKEPALTAAQLQQGLPADEVALLNEQSGLLLKKTPLWYYVLREATVLGNGDRLGPVGGRIVAETFVRMLRRDATSFLNKAGGFTPSLPAATAGSFGFADLVNFAGVTKP